MTGRTFIQNSRIGRCSYQLRSDQIEVSRLTGKRSDQIPGVQWAPIPDRSVLGSINDFIRVADYHFDESDLTPALLSQLLGITPMSTLGMNNPARAFATLRS